ncbi:hypothetical protein B0H14DRAFT_2579372 [Mycena olivaceomarginata]|nr:hypothetical protein B0H14DRAFT_2579372 [Mycena olivaceomarginata]
MYLSLPLLFQSLSFLPSRSLVIILILAPPAPYRPAGQRWRDGDPAQVQRDRGLYDPEHALSKPTGAQVAGPGGYNRRPFQCSLLHHCEDGIQERPNCARDVPQFNLTGVASGVLISTAFTPFAMPNLKARGAGRGAVLTGPVLKTRLTSGSLPPLVNLELQNKATPWQMSAWTTSGKAIIPCADATCA